MAVNRRSRGREVNGILLLDKPAGITSNAALQRAKRIYNAAKAGHTGALDPLATGMLPICFGEATKFSQFLLESDKRYRVVARLGQRTTTSDADGELVCERPVQVGEAALEQALIRFRGEISQVPSMYSALKYQGQPLYKYARAGVEVPREPRPVTIYELKVLEFAGQRLELEIHCSKGTYIRTLVDDLGELLGCGAHVSALRRLQVASYPAEQMQSLEQLECILEHARAEESAPRLELDPLLLPVDTAVGHLPDVNMSELVAGYLLQGQAVQVPGAPLDGLVRLTEGEAHRFLGVGEIDDQGRVAPKRLVSSSVK